MKTINYNLFDLEKFMSDLKKRSNLLNTLWGIKKQYPHLLVKNTNSNNKNFLISYIIEVSYTKTNMFLYLKNPDGKLLVFCSSGFTLKKKRDKENQKVILDIFFDTLIQKKVVLNKPVALHLMNTGKQRKKIIKKFQKFFYIRVLKIFNLYPHNGCRQRKLKRRKKFYE